jgi:hypothetical protein
VSRFGVLYMPVLGAGLESRCPYFTWIHPVKEA